ncbi:MAG: hypothetical protein AAF404_14455 [Pseudomonadota bacterium]
MSRMGRPEPTGHRRVSDALSLCIETDAQMHDNKTTATTCVASLTTGDIGFVHDSELPVDSLVHITMIIGAHATPVRLLSQVAECAMQTSAGNKGFNTRLVFIDADKEAIDLLAQHIETVFEQTRVIKELPYRRSA